jgi:hypothetical protein
MLHSNLNINCLVVGERNDFVFPSCSILDFRQFFGPPFVMHLRCNFPRNFHVGQQFLEQLQRRGYFHLEVSIRFHILTGADAIESTVRASSAPIIHTAPERSLSTVSLPTHQTPTKAGVTREADGSASRRAYCIV